MAVTTYRYDKVITAVVKTTEMEYIWGTPQEREIIVVTWTEQKYRKKKVRPALGDDYYVDDHYEVKTRQEYKYTPERFEELKAQIGKPTLVSHTEDPFAFKAPND